MTIISRSSFNVRFFVCPECLECLFIPAVGDLVIDADAGLIFEPVKFTKTKSAGSYTLTYESLNPIDGSRVELKQLHNK